MDQARLSLTGKPWLAAKLAWQGAYDAHRPTAWARDLLASRGIVGDHAQTHYISPSLSTLADPLAMVDMDRAVARLERALAQGEPICIYGDYDVDGVCATAIMVQVLGAWGGQVSYHIPERRQEGYGLNVAAVEAIARRARLLVSVDCGVTAVAEVAAARRLGCDVIVVDHHQAGPALPEAAAVLDPHRADCGYPFKGLCAAGLAFMLAVALRRQLRGRDPKDPRGALDVRPLLDLVALATVADMVPMQDSNRALVAAGLRRMRRWPRPGLAALAEVAGLDLGQVTTADLGYRLGPRVNARGRMSDAKLAVALMLCREPPAARAMAQALDDANRARRTAEGAAVAEATRMVESHDWQQQAALVLASPSWHCGVVGLVASRLAQRFGLPTLVIGEGGRGSARTSGGLDILAALRSCQAHLVRVGGHRAAAGCSVAPEQVAPLREALVAAAARALGPPPYLRPLAPDVAVEPVALTLATAQMCARLEPFGQANPEPLFVANNLEVRHKRRLGTDHFRLSLAGEAEAIAFNMGALAEQVGEQVDLAFHLQENRFGGRCRAQLRVVDIRRAG